MAETCVPDKLTPTTPTELYEALLSVWQPTVGSLPSRASLLILLAHWALETGFGHACHCFNLGNKKHVKGDGRDYTMFRCNEVLSGKTVWFDPPAPETWFVAFPTLAAGAADYVAGLMKHFGAAWLDVVAGDAAKFCHDLKVERYYTADEALYTAGVVRCMHQIDASLPPEAEPPPDPTAVAAAEAEAAAINDRGFGPAPDRDPPPPADEG